MYRGDILCVEVWYWLVTCGGMGERKGRKKNVQNLGWVTPSADFVLIHSDGVGEGGGGEGDGLCEARLAKELLRVLDLGSMGILEGQDRQENEQTVLHFRAGGWEKCITQNCSNLKGTQKGPRSDKPNWSRILLK